VSDKPAELEDKKKPEENELKESELGEVAGGVTVYVRGKANPPPSDVQLLDDSPCSPLWLLEPLLPRLNAASGQASA
jgi:hypothetical protein